ncbi:Uncharacterised protein [Candidatus Bilamarchaeum dharawalense]|uniref:Uncharacterized protein n=1 Tax=Candidatus Bilamarchaeum dharawalense TaxID=2885759 RepID=A0A5E4LMB3_9ARCH|nr:Uncharacterised protein [Candidatus Bilamarchaeum dharawalense]
MWKTNSALVNIEIMMTLLEMITEEPVSVHKMVYRTKLNSRTIVKYLLIVELAQNTKRIVKEMKGSRVYFRKER